MEKVISTLVWAALIQGVLLAVLYLFSKKHRSFANRLLGFFLLLIVYEGTIVFMPYDHIFSYRIYYFSLPEVKLFYPLLFFHYILEKVERSNRYRGFLRFHYLLAAGIAGITLINLLLFVFNGRKIEAYLGMKTVEFFFMAQQYYAFILIIAVLIFSIVEVNRYKRVVQKEYSDYEMLNINWLWRLIFAVVPIVVLWGVDLIRIALGGKNDFSFELMTWGFVVIFIYFVSFQAFKHKNLFEGVEERPEGTDNNSPKSKHGKHAPANSIVGPSEDEELIQHIKTYMEKQEPYLDASLSIYQLAKQLNMPVRELSLLINHKLDKHFFDLVNEYRVKKAMEILRDPKKRKMTVLEILYEVGFNSKSSFNTVFKKYTGKTPTEYRKTSLQTVRLQSK
jgi:AraC-like DNA-binding protein